ncbi:hypothetical protein K0M31_012039 [Melipona bicolor]|uniref:C2H2-type domain-containing protein n=1 Tax=Melipona bicolor TaxID=60889 RepID=A0AA40KVC9_9HYME|nr:hypothetical protein K0M31_012039 [Melipona bicolor]
MTRGCQPLRTPNCVGPPKFKKASDGKSIRDAPAGASRSTRPPQNPQPSTSSANPTPPDSFQCLFPGCDRTFTTKTGRGVHMRRMHPDWSDDVNRAESFSGWDVLSHPPIALILRLRITICFVLCKTL